MAQDAWKEVDTTTVRNCWRKAGILPNQPVPLPREQLALPISSLIHSTNSDSEQVVATALDEPEATGALQRSNRMDIAEFLNPVAIATVDATKAVYGFVQRRLSRATQGAGTNKAQGVPSDEDAMHGSRNASIDETKAGVKPTADRSQDVCGRVEGTALARGNRQSHGLQSTRLMEIALEPTPTPDSSPPLPEAPAANVETFVFSENPEDGGPAPKPKVEAEALPLAAPAISDITISEPIASHLAGTIDDLASCLKANPSVAEKAKDIPATAKGDPTDLATRLSKIKEDEKRGLALQREGYERSDERPVSKLDVPSRLN
ncbi:hypothetical protein J3R83DRAFT_5517 [Lanmaoa asiatica]|nr:hypothetical protein J3R83DRAFT_5517 [Lanmaoa asiatica]